MPTPPPDTIAILEQSPRRGHSLPVQFVDLLIIELSNWRWGWRSMVIIGMVFPLLSMMLLGSFARDLGNDALAYILTGNIVLALLFEHQGKLTSHFSFMRMAGALDYFATLPVQKMVLILAAWAAFFILFIPVLLTTLVGGMLILHVELHLHPLALIVVPLCALPLAGVGALIGTSFRTPEEANAVDRLLTVLMLALGPVLVQPERLPSWLVTLGYLSPATYAASALRQVFLGPVTNRLILDL
ncbi:MAG: ABC transporter permease, partial [Caldilineaceae bacterium]|nr:ABC transporter permease [Caldilineaceae bacterium]